MNRKIRLLALLLAAATLLTGCSLSLESIGLGKLYGMLDNGPIICKITQKDGQLLTVEVLSPDSHYDEEETLYVQYTAITGGKNIEEGDIITFSYDYLEGVSVKNDLPFILAESVSPTEYVPPETDETTE